MDVQPKGAYADCLTQMTPEQEISGSLKAGLLDAEVDE
jgi:hypothetical protein